MTETGVKEALDDSSVNIVLKDSFEEHIPVREGPGCSQTQWPADENAAQSHEFFQKLKETVSTAKGGFDRYVDEEVHAHLKAQQFRRSQPPEKLYFDMGYDIQHLLKWLLTFSAGGAGVLLLEKLKPYLLGWMKNRSGGRCVSRKETSKSKSRAKMTSTR